MGSTRFMKVARVDHTEGPMVMKVFVVVDQSFAIEPYRDQILQIRNKIIRFANCCPFTNVYVKKIFVLFLNDKFSDDKQMRYNLSAISKMHTL